MTATASSLRLRLFIGALGAGLLACALLSLALLSEVRDGLYARRIADAREVLQAEANVLETRCGAVSACLPEALGHREAAGFRLSAAPCVAPSLRAGAMAILCADLPGQSGSLHLHVQLEPVREQLRALDEEMLAAVAMALVLSVLLSIFILERGVVRRLSEVNTALSALDAQGDRPFLPEGGDALGRLGGAVNRLSERLAEERARTQAQIVSLQAANRALAEEQQALREARADLSRSERLASVGRLAAGVAHEVGNPLSAVIAYTSLLRDRLVGLGGVGGVATAEAREFAERIERESARVDRILRDLLDLARPREVLLEPVDLAQAIAVAGALVAPQPTFKLCAISTELTGSLPRGLGEEHYVVQVLVNLFSNAAKAGANVVRVTAQVEERAVILELADDGSGIAPEILPRLFEPFVTTASPGQGTGLGLALSHATMERIGGSITARAGESSGAVFSLRFRRAP